MKDDYKVIIEDEATWLVWSGKQLIQLKEQCEINLTAIQKLITRNEKLREKCEVSHLFWQDFSGLDENINDKDAEIKRILAWIRNHDKWEHVSDIELGLVPDD